MHLKVLSPDTYLIRSLIDKAICFSNADNGVAHIVLGVSDKATGPAAFTGTERSCDWLVEKIYNNTQPSIQVEAFEIEWASTRLIILRVPKGMTLYHSSKGQASKRVGKNCVPLTEDERSRIAFSRAHPDLTAAKSRRGLEDLDPNALERAKTLLGVRKKALGDTSPIPETPLELCDELGLLTTDNSLTVAAEILFMQPRYNRPTVLHFLRNVPRGAPQITGISAPLITALEQVRSLISANISQEVARVRLPNGREIAIPAFPADAVDETISNAFAHRDWGAASAIEIDQSPIELVVWSPGGLPAGVSRDELLSTQSIPRNPVLMGALRRLGLAEESSRGLERMWVSMLSSGRPAPKLVAGLFVRAALSSGRVDTHFIEALAQLRAIFREDIFNSVYGLLVTRHLADNPILTATTAARLMQVSESEAQEILSWYTSEGFLEQLRDAPEWVLSAEARAAFGKQDTTATPALTIEEWILTQLREGKSLNAREVADELGVERESVSVLLRHLRDTGEARIAPNSPKRGPSVRWISAYARYWGAINNF
ncbi:MAG: ATP-binding protein [Actinomycetaceae bacterium]|nr:ATP-binding protein [Actinomycetaceae bacterium]